METTGLPFLANNSFVRVFFECVRFACSTDLDPPSLNKGFLVIISYFILWIFNDLFSFYDRRLDLRSNVFFAKDGAIYEETTDYVASFVYNISILYVTEVIASFSVVLALRMSVCESNIFISSMVKSV